MGRRRLLSILLSVALLMSMFCVSVVAAADTTKIEFGQVSGKAGEQIQVPVMITGNPGIAGFRFWVAYDMDALTLVSVEKGEVLTSGTLKSNVDDEDATITWFAISNETGNGELMTLTFEIAENAMGYYPLTVSYDPEDITNASWQKVDCTVTDGLIKTGSRISGSITSFGDANGEVTLKLLSGETEVAATTSTDGTYYLDSVASGMYTLQVSKESHATCIYEITVADQNIIQDIALFLLGDLNGDGEINNQDVIQLLWHTLFPENYSLTQDADFDGDSEMNNQDVIYLLWHTLFPENYPLH